MQEHLAPQARLIEGLGYEPLRAMAVKDIRQTFQVTRGGRYFAFKIYAGDQATTPYATLVHGLLPKMRRPFERLVLPRFVDHGWARAVGHYVIMTWIPGRDFFGRWHAERQDLAGGRALDRSIVELALGMVRDLCEVPAGDLVRAGVRAWTRGTIERIGRRHLEMLLTHGALSSADARRIHALLAHLAAAMDSGPLRVSNEDFRFFNFIEISPQKTGLVDWDGARASRFEAEHCVAFLWLHLWNRPRLQERLLSGARARLMIDRATFRGALLLSTLAQAAVWRRQDDLCQRQIGYARQALCEDAFDRLWESRSRLESPP